MAMVAIVVMLTAKMMGANYATAFRLVAAVRATAGPMLARRKAEGQSQPGLVAAKVVHCSLVSGSLYPEVHRK